MGSIKSDKEQKSSNRRSLFDIVISDENIYNAIYALDSFIFEKGLLDRKDIRLLHRLEDKFDFKCIGKIIGRCKKRLVRILSDPHDIFNVKVYFKMKKWDDGKVKFRPLHTASLIDQICMVALLMPLLFDDTSGERKLSELSKLIPHNFYGNIPSTDVNRLFKKWNIQYKEYSDAVVNHCRMYQKSHEFMTEVTLDIKNFFPSICPKFLFEYIIGILSSAFPSQEDKITLAKIVTKLLYFNISPDNLKGWEEEYYGRYIDVSQCAMVAGIPQGLPQSYLFGNLCMIEIKKIMESPDLFEGDSYYYVDDSVLYLKSEIETADEFKKKIKNLNQRINERFRISEADSYVHLFGEGGDTLLDVSYLDFQKMLQYEISFYDNEKSSYVPIDDADNHLGGIDNLARQISGGASIYKNIDDIEDEISLAKLTALDQVITGELDKIKSKISKVQKKDDELKFESRLKFLKRYKRFFLWRQRLMQIKNEGEVTNEYVKRFEASNYLNYEDSKNKDGADNVIDDSIREKWLGLSDEDIFRSEYSLILRCLCSGEASRLQKKIASFEKRIADKVNDSYLYYSQDSKSILIVRDLSVDRYCSLKYWARKYFSGEIGISQSILLNRFCSHSESVLKKINGYGFPEYIKFIFHNSDDFKRRVLNALFSYMIGVSISEATTFVKNSSRPIYYLELRILAMLRNYSFGCHKFMDFIKNLDQSDLSNQMAIDMGILEVLGLFIQKVADPFKVDDLIITHRLVKGLWQNGSKFLYSYTLHNEEHAVTLIKKAIHLEKTIDYLNIKRDDFYILFLACYLHDISMVIHPDIHQIDTENNHTRQLITDLLCTLNESKDKFTPSTREGARKYDSHLKEAGKFMIGVFQRVYDYFEGEIRDSHPKSSADFIRKSAGSFLSFIPRPILSFVAETSESHGYDSKEIYGEKSKAKDDLISRKYLKILIRLADLMDVANNRINYYLLRQNGLNLSETSRFHWISHLITESIELKARYGVMEGKGLRERPITECLNFNIYLNTKYLTSVNKGTSACEDCDCIYPCDNEICEEGYGELDALTLRIGRKCKSPQCLFICKWVLKKHGWLVNELKELQNYLRTVNNSLFTTEIRLNVFFSDSYSLDPDLFDNVRKMIEDS